MILSDVPARSFRKKPQKEPSPSRLVGSQDEFLPVPSQMVPLSSEQLGASFDPFQPVPARKKSSL